MGEKFRKLFLAFLVLAVSFMFSVSFALPANAKVYSIEHDDESTQLKELHNQVRQNTNDISQLYSMVNAQNTWAYNSYSGWYGGYGNVCDNLATIYNSYYAGTGNEMELLSIISYCRSYDYYNSGDNDCNDNKDDCGDDDDDDCDSNDDCDDKDNCNGHGNHRRCNHSHDFWDNYWDDYWDEYGNECRWGDDCYSHNHRNDYAPNECWGAETYEEYLECRNDHYPHYRNDPPPEYFSHDGITDYGEDAYRSWADLCQREQQSGYYSDWCNERRWWITGTVN